MRTASLLFLSVLASWRLGVCQDASPYVPLSWWGTAYVEHLIARGRIADPTPLTRPFRQADLLRALEAADSATLTGAEWRVVRRMRTDLERRERGPAARLDVHAGVAAGSYARRDALRAAGAGHGDVSGGVSLALLFGPVAVVTHPYFDTRLKWDPDYEGKKDRVIAGRNAEAYATAQWRYGDLFFGSLDRNWGPPAVEGLLLSPSPYSYDHFGVSLGTSGVRLEGVLTQLDDLPDTSGTLNHRYWVAHRLVLRPPGKTTLALWEGSLLAGPGRQLEPWYANIATFGLLAQYDQQNQVNSLVGVDVLTRVGGTTLFGSMLIDDIQVDRSSATDKEPPQYGLTLGARGGVGAWGWTAFYTQVANLTYRTDKPAEVVMRRGVGLARNFSDYDQLTLRATLLPAPGSLLAPEVTLLRQGEGDFRLPYPPVTAYDSTPTFLAGVVVRTVRLAVGGQLSAGAWSLTGDGGVHLISNAGHVAGARDTRWVGRLELTFRYRKESLVP
ncbi:MAG TPA: hypothetical protein VGQ06_10710 [Gemmatimonadales bacterium]|jgi:hypothetical protein|nr:hypothetical protein [Gemmatimonadales bacterium]